MKNKVIPTILLILSATVAKAQNSEHKMTEAQKADAAKADVFISNSEKKITDSFIIKKKDSAAAIKQSKKRSCAKRNKKSS